MRRIKPKKPAKIPDKAALKEVIRPLVREFVESGIWVVLADDKLRLCFSRLCLHEDRADCVEAIAVAMCDAQSEEPVAS